MVKIYITRSEVRSGGRQTDRAETLAVLPQCVPLEPLFVTGPSTIFTASKTDGGEMNHPSGRAVGILSPVHYT